jgi:hypothetical protein
MCKYYVVNEVILPIKPDWLIIPVVIKQPSGISLPLSLYIYTYTRILFDGCNSNPHDGIQSSLNHQSARVEYCMVIEQFAKETGPFKD